MMKRNVVAMVGIVMRITGADRSAKAQTKITVIYAQVIGMDG
jgi:hypothetical protein